MDDPYTMDARLCDADGMVSHETVADPQLLEAPGTTYLDRVHNFRARTYLAHGDRVPDRIDIPYGCTGHAHLMGEHMRCTSPAHRPVPAWAATPVGAVWEAAGGVAAMDAPVLFTEAKGTVTINGNTFTVDNLAVS